MLTGERLRELVKYDPDTGVFTSRVNARKVKIGDRLGYDHPKGYLTIYLEGRLYLSHRLAFLYMTNEWPSSFVGHSNGDRKDNRWEKLSELTPSDNSRDMKLFSSNTSGVCGVSKASSGSWLSVIYDKCGNRIRLYQGPDFEEACRLRREAEVEYGYHEGHGKR